MSLEAQAEDNWLQHEGQMALYERHRKAILGYLHRYLSSWEDAEDL